MPSSNKIQKILLLSACAVSLVASGADVAGGCGSGGSGLTGGGGSTIGSSAAGATEKIFHATNHKNAGKSFNGTYDGDIEFSRAANGDIIFKKDATTFTINGAEAQAGNYTKTVGDKRLVIINETKKLAKSPTWYDAQAVILLRYNIYDQSKIGDKDQDSYEGYFTTGKKHVHPTENIGDGTTRFSGRLLGHLIDKKTQKTETLSGSSIVEVNFKKQTAIARFSTITPLDAKGERTDWSFAMRDGRLSKDGFTGH